MTYILQKSWKYLLCFCHGCIATQPAQPVNQGKQKDSGIHLLQLEHVLAALSHFLLCSFSLSSSSVCTSSSVLLFVLDHIHQHENVPWYFFFLKILPKLHTFFTFSHFFFPHLLAKDLKNANYLSTFSLLVLFSAFFNWLSTLPSMTVTLLH